MLLLGRGFLSSKTMREEENQQQKKTHKRMTVIWNGCVRQEDYGQNIISHHVSIKFLGSLFLWDRGQVSTLGPSLQQSPAEEAKFRLMQLRTLSCAVLETNKAFSPSNFFLWMGRRVTGRGQQYEELTNWKLLLSWLHAKVTMYFCFLF